MNDFWISSGHHLLDRDREGGLHVTDEFLKLYLARPELIPPPDACAVERTRMPPCSPTRACPVSASDIAAIADPDARDNWHLMIDFRDHLLRHKTLEAPISDLVRNGVGNIPPLFMNQLVHVILRNALDGVHDRARAARRRTVFPHPACHLARGLADCVADEETIGGINPHRCRRWSRCLAFQPRRIST